MCCAVVALAMTLLASWRGVSGTLIGRAGWLRRIAIVLIAITLISIRMLRKRLGRRRPSRVEHAAEPAFLRSSRSSCSASRRGGALLTSALLRRTLAHRFGKSL